MAFPGSAGILPAYCRLEGGATSRPKQRGHSLESLICLRCASPDIATMVLAGAATDSMKYKWDKFYSKDQMRELEDKGRITDAGNSPLRKQVVIDRQALQGVGFSDRFNQPLGI